MKFPAVYPLVKTILTPDIFNRGPMTPKGVTVSFSADRRLDKFYRGLKKKETGYHLVIDRDGTVTQLAYANQKINHAGKAEWNHLDPNESHLSVCLLSWGAIIPFGENFRSWNGTIVGKSEAVLEIDILGQQFYWDKATVLQEERLFDVLSWAVTFGIDPQNICGHDECALPSGRSDSPGGIISIPMNEIRDRYVV